METITRSVLDASRKLIEANDEKGIIQVVLQLAIELTGSTGASFVPLDDRGYPLAVVRQGQFNVSIPDAWLEYLASPSVRQKCSLCGQLGQLTQSCQLLDGPFSEASEIYCLPVRYADHDLGILNLFFPAPGSQQPDTLELLQFLLINSALAIANQRLQRRELAMFDQYRSVRQRVESKPLDELPGQPGCLEDRLIEIRYKIQMEERTRLAREIHDGLAQTLGFLKLQVAQLISSLDKNNPDRLRQISLSLHDALEDAYLGVRESINMLRVVPGEPGEARLGNWLRRTVEEFQENTDIRVNIEELVIQSNFPDEVHLQLIRIIQEALVNVRKHAYAHQILISCREVDHVLVVEIQDDGRGFCADDVPEPSQHGLKGMRERAVLIGADLEFVSQPDQGTTVRIVLPLMAEWGIR